MSTPSPQQSRAMADAGAKLVQKLVDLAKRLRARIDGRAYTDMREHDTFVEAHQRLGKAIAQITTALPQVASAQLDIHDWIEAAHKVADATKQLAELSGQNPDLVKEADDFSSSIEPTIAEAYNGGGNTLWGVAAVAATALAITYAISKSNEEEEEKRRRFYDPTYVKPGKQQEEEPPEPEADENGVIG